MVKDVILLSYVIMTSWPLITPECTCAFFFFFFIQLNSSTDQGLGSPAQSLMLSLV